MDAQLLSSKNMNWETPRYFYERLNQEFNFKIDLAASKSNSKCDTFLSEEDDSLSKQWGGLIEQYGNAFLNPPYGRTLKKWVKKTYEESKMTHNKIVMLIPARTDTSYFHDYILGKAEIRFIKGRLYFELDGEPIDRAPFPSMIVVYNPDHGERITSYIV